MPDFACWDGGQAVGEVGAASTDYGVTVTASATVNTMGAWTTIQASTPFDADGLILIAGEAGLGGSILLNLGINDGVANEIIVENMLLDLSTLHRRTAMFLPIPVRAGVDLRAQCQSATASNTCFVGVQLVRWGLKRFGGLVGRATVYGTTASNSLGTDVDPGVTANTKGVYAVLSTSTANPIKLLAMTVGVSSNGVMTDARWRFDIGYGAASSEQVLIPDLLYCNQATIDDLSLGMDLLWPVNIPAGSRLVVKSQCTITDATDRVLSVAITGFD